VLSEYHPSYIPVERVRPLALWLLNRYANLQEVADVTGLPVGTLNALIWNNKKKSVRPETARVLVDIVQMHKRPDDTFASYENEDTPRLPTVADEEALRAMKLWKSYSTNRLRNA